jgi:hypothetical protein
VSVCVRERERYVKKSWAYGVDDNMEPIDV